MARLRNLALALGLVAIAAIGLVVNENARKAEERRELLSLVATVSSDPVSCRDDRVPFQVTIRNLTSRTVTAASFQFRQDPMPPGTLPSDVPVVSLEEPLPPGQGVTACRALNRLQLFARGLDPRSIRFAPIVLPETVVFAR